MWHGHQEPDGRFLVRKGEFRLYFRDGAATLMPSALNVGPRAVEHRQYAGRGQFLSGQAARV